MKFPARLASLESASLLTAGVLTLGGCFPQGEEAREESRISEIDIERVIKNDARTTIMFATAEVASCQTVIDEASPETRTVLTELQQNPNVAVTHLSYEAINQTVGGLFKKFGNALMNVLTYEACQRTAPSLRGEALTIEFGCTFTNNDPRSCSVLEPESLRARTKAQGNS